MNSILEIERFRQHCKIIGVGIHLIAIPRLSRPSVPATVVSDAAISVGGEEKHLVLESVRAQWPSMAENHGLSAAPVFVVDLCSIRRAYVWHLALLNIR
jgi:hypothetical protein